MKLSNMLRGAAVAALAILAVAPAVHADALDDVRKAKKIRIAIDFGVPPYGMTDAQMQPAGSDVDMAEPGLSVRLHQSGPIPLNVAFSCAPLASSTPTVNSPIGK